LLAQLVEQVTLNHRVGGSSPSQPTYNLSVADAKRISPRFHLLDLSRGIAAFGILIFHLSGTTKPLNSLYILVDFFFVLSGFVLHEQTPKKTNFLVLKIFIKKRINRLVPTAWFAITISYLTYSIFLLLDVINPQKELDINLVTFLSALLFLQFIVPSSAVLLIPMWSLSVELFVNLIIGLLGVTRKNIIIMASFAMLMLSAFVLSGSAINGTSGWIAFSRGIFGFSCGLMARILFNKEISSNRIQNAASIIIVGAIFWLVASSSFYLVLVAPSMAFLVYTISSTEFENRRFKAFCTQCGEFSYGIYLWHFPVIKFVDLLLPDSNPNLTHYWLKILELLITVLVSLVLTKIGLILFKKVEIFKIH
jgi:peptidoglycan/LPS O-acetylase OafA/YrhL